MIILEDVFPTVRATSHLAYNINTTRWARFCAVANLMAAFGTLDYHIVNLQFNDLQFTIYFVI